MLEGVKENGLEDADKVIRSVLGKRHADETNNLDRQFAAEKKVMVDDALHKLGQKYEKLQESMKKKHDAQLTDLQVRAHSYDTSRCPHVYFKYFPLVYYTNLCVWLAFRSRDCHRKTTRHRGRHC